MVERKRFIQDALIYTNYGEAYRFAFGILETLRDRDTLVEVVEKPKEHFWERRKWVVRIGWYY